MQPFHYFLIAFVLIAGLIALGIVAKLYSRTIIFEHERGLLFVNGKFVRILEPGLHHFLKPNVSVQKVDMRSQRVILSGQEILTSDNITVRISLTTAYKINAPYIFFLSSSNPREDIHTILQDELRNQVSGIPVEELLAKRNGLTDTLLQQTRSKFSDYGIDLISVTIRDIMFPGDLKNIFAKVLNARLEGLATLERARGESAAIRNLANSAKLLETNPGLYQLRLLQLLGEKDNNTIILSSSNPTDHPTILPTHG